MSRRKNVLAVFRRQRDRLGRLVVALFAIASFTVTGAPCLAMVTADTDASDQPTAAPGREHQEHQEHQEHEASHRDTGFAAHGDGSQQNVPPHCPHCPSSGVMPNHPPSSAHSFCSAFDELADQTSLGSSPAFAKHFLVVAPFETPPPLVFHPPPTRSLRAIAPQVSAVRLNLRNCVFLI
jgi:hypothetical protein